MPELLADASRGSGELSFSGAGLGAQRCGRSSAGATRCSSSAGVGVQHAVKCAQVCSSHPYGCHRATEMPSWCGGCGCSAAASAKQQSACDAVAQGQQEQQQCSGNRAARIRGHGSILPASLMVRACCGGVGAVLWWRQQKSCGASKMGKFTHLRRIQISKSEFQGLLSPAIIIVHRPER